jgi:hypothetical protein
MRYFRRLLDDRTASAGAEMALSLPLMLVLLFGAFDLGNYFMSEHVVQKAVRDAARYAARMPMTNFPACVPTTDAETEIRKVARTGAPDGDVDGDGTEDLRLADWTSDAMTTVTVTCDTTVIANGTYSGIYSEFPNGIAVVTVQAEVPYTTLFGLVGLGVSALELNATSQAAMVGA